MGRRRRKVIRIPKKRLPKFFDCPECGKTKCITIRISPTKMTVTAKCGECGGEDIKMLSGGSVSLNCPNCNQQIARVKLIELGTRIIIECGKCHRRNILQMPVMEAPFNCSCEPSKQGKLTIRPAGKFAEVNCASCGLTSYFIPRAIDEPVDIYARFLDKYYGKG